MYFFIGIILSLTIYSSNLQSAAWCECFGGPRTSCGAGYNGIDESFVAPAPDQPTCDSYSGTCVGQRYANLCNWNR